MQQKRFFVPFIVLAYFFCIPGSQAFTFTLSQQDLNQFIGMAFPQTQYYQGIKAVFDHPVITLSDNNQVAVNVDIDATQGSQYVKANATLSGKIYYDGIKGELQIIRPMLEDVTLTESTLNDDAQVRRWIEQLTGQSAPMILLLDFRSLNLSFIGNRVPRAMHVEKGQLVIDY
ncbi:DUF1439 domain-containing protein [Aestuariibacter sp. A3R04]|uniref:DUF1439 domain-containing protein n=1 Tax=Aestuariibacter sp. A3R04 TaxID=2841571 RepID=UPI001C0874B0|nr:DUF1439 domain-containing protein [Aestuariibacter sp. A3R04]MBU3023688.1 DUF1439 domain-containing protein [Aestuariibacter sp. A3R04]